MKRDDPNHIGPIDVDNKYSIYAGALSLMALFTDSILKILDKKYVELYGENWQQKFAVDGFLPENFNARDMHSLFKELARNSQSQLRLPLNERIEKFDQRKIFFDELDNLLAERNAWVHRQIDESKSELIDLIDLVRLIAGLVRIPVAEECDRIKLQLIKNSKDDSDHVNKQLPGDRPKDVSEIQLNKSWVIGDPVVGQFTSHSYLVLENGDVKDRVSEEFLSAINPVLHSQLFPILKNLKAGSRLRLTRDGVLSAFIQDKWAFIRLVSAEEWFPGHLAFKKH